MVWNSRTFRALILFTILWESSAITNRKTYKQYGATRNFRHIASPYQSSPSMDWEIGLREAVHQALLREHYLDPNLQSRLQNAPIIGKQNSATPFGDVAVLARGQLYALSGGNFAFVQDPYSNDCDECHNARRRRCGIDHCEHLNPPHQDRLVALWTVKRLRHRSHNNYNYEVQYTVSPMTPSIKEALIKRDGWFDYALPGHVFVIRNDLPNRNQPTNLHTEVFNRKHPHNHFNPEVLIAVDSDGRKHFLHSYPAFYTSSAPKSTHDHREQDLYRKLIETLASKTSTTQKEEGPYKVSLNHFGDITKSSYYKTPTTGSESMVPLSPVYVPVTTPQKPTIANILPTPELKTTQTIPPVSRPEATQPMKVTFHYFMAEEDEEKDEGRGLITKAMEKVPLITKTTTRKPPTQKFTTTTETYGADFLFPEMPRVKSKKKYKPPKTKIKTETEGDFLFTTPPAKHTKKMETLTSDSSSIFTAKHTIPANTETTTSKTPTMATPWQTTPLMTMSVETTQTTAKNQIEDTTYFRQPTLMTSILTKKPTSTTAFTKPVVFTKYSEVPTRKTTKLTTASTKHTMSTPTSPRRSNLTSIKASVIRTKSTSALKTTNTTRKPILTTLPTKSASIMMKTSPKSLPASRRFGRPNLASNVSSKLSSSNYKVPSSKSTTTASTTQSTPTPTTTLKYELTTETSFEEVMNPVPTLFTTKFTQPVLETEDMTFFTKTVSTTVPIISKLTTQPITSPATTIVTTKFTTSSTPFTTIGQTEPSLILTKTTAEVTNPPLTTTLSTTKKKPTTSILTTIPTEFTQSLSTLTQVTNTPTIEATEAPTKGETTHEIPITTDMKESTISNYHIISETNPTEPMKTTQFISNTKTELVTQVTKELETTVPYTTPSTVWLTKPTTPMKTSQEQTTKTTEETKTTELTTMKSSEDFTQEIKTTTKSEETMKSPNIESTTGYSTQLVTNATQSTTASAPTKITTQSTNTFLSNSDNINEPINVKPAVKDYSDDDIFGPTKSTSKPIKTSTAKVTESELASQLFDSNRKRAFKNSRIIFSNFFEASTTPVPLETVSKEELPRTSQSVETSISYEVNKRKKSSLTNLGYLPPMEITTKSVEEKTQAVTEEPKKVFDNLATQLVNHARTIDYLNRTENKTSSKPKYKRRKNYIPRNRKLNRERVVAKEN